MGKWEGCGRYHYVVAVGNYYYIMKPMGVRIIYIVWLHNIFFKAGCDCVCMSLFCVGINNVLCVCAGQFGDASLIWLIGWGIMLHACTCFHSFTQSYLHSPRQCLNQTQSKTLKQIYKLLLK